MTLLRKITGSIRLYFGIVGRYGPADYRLGPIIAGEIVYIMYWKNHYRKEG